MATQDTIKILQWGRPTSGLRGTDTQLPISILAGFLSNQWLSEHHLDLIGLCLNAPPDIVVEASLATTVKGLVGKTVEQVLAVQPLGQLQEEVQSGQCKRIFFPTNINNVHWVVFCVCTASRTIYYSMPTSSCIRPPAHRPAMDIQETLVRVTADDGGKRLSSIYEVT